MNPVKVPRSSVVVAVVCLFALALYAVREYGAVGAVSDLAMAVGALVVCVAIVTGLIWANYETYGCDSDRGCGKA